MKEKDYKVHVVGFGCTGQRCTGQLHTYLALKSNLKVCYKIGLLKLVQVEHANITEKVSCKYQGVSFLS